MENTNSWMHDPRCKHEYLNKFSKTPGNAGDISDKHLEARDHRYLC